MSGMKKASEVLLDELVGRLIAADSEADARPIWDPSHHLWLWRAYRLRGRAQRLQAAIWAMDRGTRDRRPVR